MAEGKSGSGGIWAEAARVGLGVLQWPPDVFWRATPAELRLALEGRFGRSGAAAPLDRAELGALARRFPDRHGNSGH